MRSQADSDRSGGGAAPTRVARAVKDVNLRAGPDNSEPVVVVIPDGRPVEVVDCNQWCEVIFDGHRGWVYKSLIGMGGSSGL